MVTGKRVLIFSVKREPLYALWAELVAGDTPPQKKPKKPKKNLNLYRRAKQQMTWIYFIVIEINKSRVIYKM